MICEFEYALKGCPYINDEKHKGRCSTSDCCNTCEQFVPMQPDRQKDIALRVLELFRDWRVLTAEIPGIIHQVEKYVEARGTRFGKTGSN